MSLIFDARPWACEPPIVHIDRMDPDGLLDEEDEDRAWDRALEMERDAEALVVGYGGTFCGT